MYVCVWILIDNFLIPSPSTYMHTCIHQNSVCDNGLVRKSGAAIQYLNRSDGYKECEVIGHYDSSRDDTYFSVSCIHCYSNSNVCMHVCMQKVLEFLYVCMYVRMYVWVLIYEFWTFPNFYSLTIIWNVCTMYMSVCINVCMYVCVSRFPYSWSTPTTPARECL